jgi:hypothetical protein
VRKPIFQSYNPNDNNIDPEYRNICDGSSEPSLRAREFVERLWAVYEPYAERDFLREIQLNFHERFWEMYLTCALLDIGLKVIKKRKPEGPDVCVQTGDNTIWFEAVCPTRGKEGKPDSVPDIMDCGGEMPTDQIALRIRSVIKEKYNDKYYQYKEGGIIQESDVYIVAVNTWQVFLSHLDNDPHPLYRSLYGVGSQKIIFDSTTFEPIELTYEERPVIYKSSGKPVVTDIFSDKEFRYLSAVLWSVANAGNPTDELGEDFLIAHNHFAVNSVPEELFEKRNLRSI